MDEKRFTLRMDGQLFEEVAELAAQHRRSVAKEIELAVAKFVHSYQYGELVNLLGEAKTDDERTCIAKQIKLLNEKYGRFE